MSWYVLIYDFNNKKIISYDIFKNSQFSEGLENIDFTQSYNDILTDIDRLAKYCFWSKREYEISVGDAFEEDINKFEKIDVYRQLEPQMRLLTDYILIYYD